MAVDETPDEAPDGTIRIVGNQGLVLDQETDSGKQIYRRGAGAPQSDIDIGSKGNPNDLADGDFDSGNKNAGGAGVLAGKVQSLDDETFTVKIKWLDDENNETVETSPKILQDQTDLEFSLRMRSDRFKVVVTDTSGANQNEVVGSVNAH